MINEMLLRSSRSSHSSGNEHWTCGGMVKNKISFVGRSGKAKLREVRLCDDGRFSWQSRGPAAWHLVLTQAGLRSAAWEGVPLGPRPRPYMSKEHVRVLGLGSPKPFPHQDLEM